MDMVYGKGHKEIHLSGSGFIQRQMDLESMHILMGIDTKELGKWA